MTSSSDMSQTSSSNVDQYFSSVTQFPAAVWRPLLTLLKNNWHSETSSVWTLRKHKASVWNHMFFNYSSINRYKRTFSTDHVIREQMSPDVPREGAAKDAPTLSVFPHIHDFTEFLVDQSEDFQNFKATELNSPVTRYCRAAISVIVFKKYQHLLWWRKAAAVDVTSISADLDVTCFVSHSNIFKN